MVVMQVAQKYYILSLQEIAKFNLYFPQTNPNTTWSVEMLLLLFTYTLQVCTAL